MVPENSSVGRAHNLFRTGNQLLPKQLTTLRA